MRTLPIATAMLALAACGGRTERAASAPSVDEVLEAELAATGGRAAWTAIRTLHVRGSLAAPGLEGTFEVTAEAPNRTHMIMRIPGSPPMEEGCDGTASWKRQQGIRLATGDELARELREAAIKTLDWHTEYDSIAVAGPAIFASRPTWRVVGTMPGLTKTMYFDRETKLQLGEKRTETEGGVTSTARMTMSDYRTYGAIQLPATVDVTEGAFTMRLTLDEVTLDQPVPAGLFAPPPETAELPPDPSGP